MATEEKSTTILTNPQGIPSALRQYPHWVHWRLEKRDDKLTKRPLQIDGTPASIKDPAHWTDFNTAVQTLKPGRGLGFVFTDELPFVFIDLDHAIVNGQWTPLAAEVLSKVRSWTELSQSGRGVHIIARASLDRSVVQHQKGLEIYKGGRFCAMTGHHIAGTPLDITDCHITVAELARQFSSSTALTPSVQDIPKPEIPYVLPDIDTPGWIKPEIRTFLSLHDATPWQHDRSAALLASAIELYRKGCSDGEVLGLLWHFCRDIAEEHRRSGDAQEWLWKYCVLPARPWKRPEPEELFQAQSTEGTQATVLTPRTFTDLREQAQELERADADGAKRILTEAISRGADVVEMDVLFTLLKDSTGITLSALRKLADSLAQQIKRAQMASQDPVEEVLQQYVYVAQAHQFRHRESGVMLKPEAWAAMYHHLGPDLKERALSSNGVERVHQLDFQPGAPRVFTRDGAVCYNIWTGLTSTGRQGDPTPWLKHVEALIPEEKARNHLLNWLACTLQHPEIKINHAVCLLGREGTGKDSLLYPVVKALGRHCETINTDALERDFQEWLIDAKLLIIEEIDVGERRSAAQIANRLKPMISRPPERLHINPKGSPAFSIPNVVNVLAYSNEYAPIYISRTDRRWWIYRTPLRVMDYHGNMLPGWEEYFERYWQWMRNGGWEIVIDYLLHRDLSRFDPYAPPPMTAAKRHVIRASLSSIDLLVERLLQSTDSPLNGTDVITYHHLERLPSWLQTAGASLMVEYGLRRVPSTRRIAQALLDAGADQIVINGMPAYRIHRESYQQQKAEDQIDLQAYATESDPMRAFYAALGMVDPVDLHKEG